MLLVSIPDRLGPQQLDRLASIVDPMRICVEADPMKAGLPLDQVEIWITYGNDVTAAALERMPALRWIQVFQSGVEYVPFEALRQKEIMLTNIRGIHGIPLSEYVLGMILYVVRHLPRYRSYQEKHLWHRQEFVEEAFGKTVSIFGAGTVGECIAERCKLLGMRVIGVNTSGAGKPAFDEMYTMREKHRVLAESDFVVLLLPATPETHHSFGKKEFDVMKGDAFLINLGRGSLVHTEALVESLKHGSIRGAALDVAEEEPLPAGHPLWDLQNVIITPHIAARTRQYFDRGLDKFRENMEAYKAGRTPPYLVDLRRGY
ncbi:D-2-hydroxyacid dehydrogenase [Brevibacillus sp. B_LB10_24]|uniref:D-2-hydroxyacid dehydrogenase n=1 Tax=Brevibacillus sp. B_LB10_24 TaxID=3380645 RepID=UPI0038B71DB3